MTTDEALDYQNLKAEIRIAGDPGDPFGTCMAWWFAVAATVFKRGDPVPEEWVYRPSPALRSGDPPEDHEEEVCAEASTGALIRFGNLLSRWRSRIGHRGENY